MKTMNYTNVKAMLVQPDEAAALEKRNRPCVMSSSPLVAKT